MCVCVCMCVRVCVNCFTHSLTTQCFNACVCVFACVCVQYLSGISTQTDSKHQSKDRTKTVNTHSHSHTHTHTHTKKKKLTVNQKSFLERKQRRVQLERFRRTIIRKLTNLKQKAFKCSKCALLRAHTPTHIPAVDHTNTNNNNPQNRNKPSNTLSHTHTHTNTHTHSPNTDAKGVKLSPVTAHTQPQTHTHIQHTNTPADTKTSTHTHSHIIAFPLTLSSAHRRVVHEESERLKLEHVSVGEGLQRWISVSVRMQHPHTQANTHQAQISDNKGNNRNMLM